MKPIDNHFFWQYPPGFIPDKLIEQTFELAKQKQREDGKLQDGGVDKTVRSVERTPLDEFDPISIFLFGAAQKANDIQSNTNWVDLANGRCCTMTRRETSTIAI